MEYGHFHHLGMGGIEEVGEEEVEQNLEEIQDGVMTPIEGEESINELQVGGDNLHVQDIFQRSHEMDGENQDIVEEEEEEEEEGEGEEIDDDEIEENEESVDNRTNIIQFKNMKNIQRENNNGNGHINKHMNGSTNYQNLNHVNHNVNHNHVNHSHVSHNVNQIVNHVNQNINHNWKKRKRTGLGDHENFEQITHQQNSNIQHVLFLKNFLF